MTGFTERMSGTAAKSRRGMVGRQQAPTPAAESRVFVLVVFFIEIIRTAWISDDSKITLRCVLNLLNGYGPNFNIDERVQAYTHPLWMLLITAFGWVTGQIFWPVLGLCIGLSLGTIYLLMRCVAGNWCIGVLVASTLVLSKAFLDYATGGLENALSHFLIVLIVVAGLRAHRTRTPLAVAGCILSAALLYLSRADLVLLMAPYVLGVLYAARERTMRAALLPAMATLPALCWTVFSLLYYGFLLPNTAYAKLATGVSLHARVMQGCLYLLDSLTRDAMTLPVIATGVCIGLRERGAGRLLSLGVISYLLYVIWIGGDFMSGRFLTAPLLVSAIIVALSNFVLRRWTVLGAGVAILAMINLNTTLLSDSSYGNTTLPANGIADERAFYFRTNSLAFATRVSLATPSWDKKLGQIKSIKGTCGYLGRFGIDNGPQTHVIDLCGLADPLLAHLPARASADWRIGHFVRDLPAEYPMSILQNTNLIKDTETHQLYDMIRLATRAPIFDPARLRGIVWLNFGIGTPPAQTHADIAPSPSIR